MNQIKETTSSPHWKGVYKAGAVAALAMLAIMLLQILIYTIWQPPETVESIFALFASNWLLGLLSLDFLYIINNTLLILIYLALFAALRQVNFTAVLIALILGITGVAAYYASNTCFELLALSQQYPGADQTQQQTLLAAGMALFATYKGTAFDIYYVLNAVALFIFAIVMLRSKVFSKVCAVFALISAFLMTIPSTAGMLGLIFSLASLIPWAVFLVLMIPQLRRLEANQAQASVTPDGLML